MQVYGISYNNTPNISSGFQTNRANERRVSFEGKTDVFVRKTQSAGQKVLNEIKHSLPAIEKIDGSDFSKLEGETVSWSDEKVISDESKGIIRKLYSRNKTRLSHVIDYDLISKHPVRGACYYDDGKTLSSIIEYAPNSEKFSKYYSYKEDGKTLDFEIEYDPETENIIRRIWYENDGVTIKKIEQQ